MSETNAKVVERSLVKPDARVRLILEDPVAFDQAIQPSLRSSAEMAPPDIPVIDRESARDLWESLSMEPAQAQQLQAERKRLLARANQLASEAEKNAAELNALKTQAAIDRDNRWNHPLIYAGAASMMGLGVLWLLERRKRMRLQERELQTWAVQTPQDSLVDSNSQSLDRTPIEDDFYESLIEEPFHRKEAPHKREKQEANFAEDMEDTPDLGEDFATDLSGLPEELKLAKHPSVQRVAARSEDASRPQQDGPLAETGAALKDQSTASVTPIQSPAWAIPSDGKDFTDSEEARIASLSPSQNQDSLLDKSRRVLRNLLQRRSQRDALFSSHPSTEVTITALQSAGQSTLLHPENTQEAVQWLPNDEAREAFEQEQLARQLRAQLHNGGVGDYDPDRANIELLSQTRIKPVSQDTAVEHLLELRTAVSGLTVLGRPEGALVLLADHIDAHPDTCAWAYLEHMQLCERLDLRDEFESMRKRYRIQFNRMAPYWHEPNANVLGLDGYSRAANELCTAWAQGSDSSHGLIAAWLIGPMLGRKLVQMPAYHDLFDLYELLEFTPENLAAQAQLEKSQEDSDAAATWAAKASPSSESEDDFVPTVSLLDLDYEFSSEVTFEEQAVKEAERAVTIVKPGNFSVDFNVAGTQLGGLFSEPAELDKK